MSAEGTGGFSFPMTRWGRRELNSWIFRHSQGVSPNGRTPLKGAVFDMDGVIVDSHPAHRRAWKQFLDSLDRPANDREIDFILDGRKREEILRHFLGELTPEEIHDYGNRKDQMLRNLGERPQPIEGSIEFLSELRHAGLTLGLATSAARARAEATLSDLGIRGFFDAIVTGDDVDAGKPDPAIYRLAAEGLGQHPEQLLAFEDAVSGVEAACFAGLHCIGVASSPRAEELLKAGAEMVVSNFKSLSLTALAAAL